MPKRVLVSPRKQLLCLRDDMNQFLSSAALPDAQVEALVCIDKMGEWRDRLNAFVETIWPPDLSKAPD